MATLDQLNEARDAYHKLMTEGGLVRVRHGTKWLEFQPADAVRLQAYISQLEAALGQTSTVRRTPARRVLF